MRLWIPLAVAAIVAVSYAFFYLISFTEGQGSTAFQLVNEIGLAAVVIGVVAAGVVLRRATPP